VLDIVAEITGAALLLASVALAYRGYRREEFTTSGKGGSP
jgi:hypothetical protein